VPFVRDAASHGARDPQLERPVDASLVLDLDLERATFRCDDRAVKKRGDAIGVECLVGIPGLVGATPMQNVGAYGQEVESTIVRVRAFDRSRGESVEMTPGDCAFGYRTSVFRGTNRFVITRVSFHLERSDLSKPIRCTELARALGVREGERAQLRDVLDGVLTLRRSKGMVLDPGDPETVSAGSFFTNPVVSRAEAAALASRAISRCGAPPAVLSSGEQVKIPAAWLIERAGFPRGFTMGRARISRKHALALVNDGASTRELLDLARAIRRGVSDAFGVTLDRSRSS
jgi:UDP-N-acetylmuramate dehydrogenase